MMKKLILAIGLLLLWGSAIAAEFEGIPSFTRREINKHQSRIVDLNKISSECLTRTRDEHVSFFNSNCRIVKGEKVCLSKFYGDRKYSRSRNARRPDGKKLIYLGDALKSIGFPQSYLSKFKNTSCVGITLNCMKEGFEKTGQSAVWKRIYKFTRNNSVDGSALQHALQKLGWKIYYWNPSRTEDIVSNARKWDKEEKDWASKGYHLYRYSTIKKNRRYWKNTVDDFTTMIGFGQGVPNLINRVPFWVGVSHTGYHVFPGAYSQVIEAHSVKDITSIANIQTSPFTPNARGGGPRWSSRAKYRSGLVALPPRLELFK